MFWLFSSVVLADTGLVYAFSSSNFAGKIIVIVLFVGSIFTWSVMLTKFRVLRLARQASRRFLRFYAMEKHPAGIFLKKQQHSGSPEYMVYEKTCDALGALADSAGVNSPDLLEGAMPGGGITITSSYLKTVRSASEKELTRQVFLLEQHMVFLALSSSTAPLLGLLGTVWGVMESFGGMALKGSAMLSAVAPGISGALLTTVIGLMVAMPSVVGYNILSDDVRRFSIETENFLEQLLADIEKAYIRE